MKTDPYLVPGQICEVWHIDYKFREIRYFSRHVIVGDNTTRPVFVRDYNAIGINAFESCFDHYRPIGTEWDFAPGWVNASLADSNGGIILTDKPEYFNFYEQFYIRHTGFKLSMGGNWVSDRKCEILYCGICPDKSRYEGEAWKTSLIDRPEWAEVG